MLQRDCQNDKKTHRKGGAAAVGEVIYEICHQAHDGASLCRVQDKMKELETNSGTRLAEGVGDTY